MLDYYYYVKCCIYNFSILFFVAVNREFQSPSQSSVDSSKSDDANPRIFQEGGGDTDVKKMIQMLEQQASLAMQGKHACVCETL